jgi:hypothetical protein
MRRGFPRPGSVVIAYLKEPRDRFWGILRSLDAVGIVMQGIDLNAFDDWVRQVAEGGEGLSPSTIFVPLGRVEKLLLESDSGPVPSLARQFERRVGRSLPDVLAPEGD